MPFSLEFSVHFDTISWNISENVKLFLGHQESIIVKIYMKNKIQALNSEM